MDNPLFSTYRSGENRVTSSTLAVFERVGLGIVTEILRTAAGLGDELRGVTFENQVQQPGSVPDARISAHFAWWFETKTERGSYDADGANRDQVRAHSQSLAAEQHAYLFVLTPDAKQPIWFTELDGVAESVRERVLWISFAGLDFAIDQVLSDASHHIGEHAQFLLHELLMLYAQEGLLSGNDTVIVGARTAWGEYREHGVYVCQPHRAFAHDTVYFGFYTAGAIQPSIAKILRIIPSVEFSPEGVAELRAQGDERAAVAVERLLAGETREEGVNFEVILLSEEHNDQTLTLKHPITNDTVTASGKRWAWTIGQRYTSSEKLLRNPNKTSELER